MSTRVYGVGAFFDADLCVTLAMTQPRHPKQLHNAKLVITTRLSSSFVFLIYFHFQPNFQLTDGTTLV